MDTNSGSRPKYNPKSILSYLGNEVDSLTKLARPSIVVLLTLIRSKNGSFWAKNDRRKIGGKRKDLTRKYKASSSKSGKNVFEDDDSRAEMKMKDLLNLRAEKAFLFPNKLRQKNNR